MRHFLLFLACAITATTLSHAQEPRPIRVVIWDERQPEQKHAYDGSYLGDHIAKELAKHEGIVVKSVGLDDPEQGLSDATLDECDVLLWWAHVRHGEISDATARRIVKRVRDGKLALVPMHSALSSKPFVLAMAHRTYADAMEDTLDALPQPETIQFRVSRPDMNAVQHKPARINPEVIVEGTPDGMVVGTIVLPSVSISSWREDGKPSHVLVRARNHPIMKGLPERFDIPQTEMYDEPFQVPKPDVLLFEEKWDAGETFRGGLLWQVGRGDVFYFRPGHETYPVFKNREPLQILENAVRWLGQRVHDHKPL